MGICSHFLQLMVIFDKQHLICLQPELGKDMSTCTAQRFYQNIKTDLWDNIKSVLSYSGIGAAEERKHLASHSACLGFCSPTKNSNGLKTGSGWERMSTWWADKGWSMWGGGGGGGWWWRGLSVEGGSIEKSHRQRNKPLSPSHPCLTPLRILLPMHL